jgi:hypothetical protein
MIISALRASIILWLLDPDLTVGAIADRRFAPCLPIPIHSTIRFILTGFFSCDPK